MASQMVDGLHIYISCSLMTLCFSIVPTAYNSIHGLYQGCRNHCNDFVGYIQPDLVLSEPDHWTYSLKKTPANSFSFSVKKFKYAFYEPFIYKTDDEYPKCNSSSFLLH